MESTSADFWRMIWENQSHAIVMLGQLKENGEVIILNCYIIDTCNYWYVCVTKNPVYINFFGNLHKPCVDILLKNDQVVNAWLHNLLKLIVLIKL